VTIWLDIDDFPLTGGPATPPELRCEPAELSTVSI
jgi:hypothetical protein